jgi:hypothetical protein
MAMFLTILFTSLLAVAFNVIVMAGLKNEEKKRADLRPAPKLGLEPSTFFDRSGARPSPSAQIPIELLMSQIESHVRQEQAAAESFLSGPTPESLRSRTTPSTLN